jgi:group I intron endonuclease
MLNGNDSGVYVLQSPSGKFYVGQTQDFSIRFWQHQNDARINARKYLSHAIRKYGWESFVKIRIPLPEEKWDAVERPRYQCGS